MKHQLFDSHFHIIDSRFPLYENQGYLPPEFTLHDYKKATESLDIIGGAVISGSFQGFDQSYLIQTLKELGNKFVGVTQVPFTISDEEIIYLNSIGVRAIRFNIKRGAAEQIQNLEYLSDRVYYLVKWHTELYVDSKDLKALMPKLLNIKKLSIDHLGLSQEGLPELKILVAHGAMVKATGFGRLNFDPIAVIKELSAINPNCVMFGTDLPSTRAPRPFSMNDIDLFIQNFDDSTNKNFFLHNALRFYF